MAFSQMKMGDGDPDLKAFDLDHALAGTGLDSLVLEISRSASLHLEVSR